MIGNRNRDFSKLTIMKKEDYLNKKIRNGTYVAYKKSCKIYKKIIFSSQLDSKVLFCICCSLHKLFDLR